MIRTLTDSGRPAFVPEDGIEVRAMKSEARLSTQVHWNERQGRFDCLVTIWEAPTAMGDRAASSGATVRQALSNAYTELLATIAGKSAAGDEVDALEEAMAVPVHREATRMARGAEDKYECLRKLERREAKRG